MIHALASLFRFWLISIGPRNLLGQLLFRRQEDKYAMQFAGVILRISSQSCEFNAVLKGVSIEALCSLQMLPSSPVTICSDL